MIFVAWPISFSFAQPQPNCNSKVIEKNKIGIDYFFNSHLDLDLFLYLEIYYTLRTKINLSKYSQFWSRTENLERTELNCLFVFAFVIYLN